VGANHEDGQGCTVHLRDGELPGGTIIVKVSRHLVTVIDGVIHDNHNCLRGGDRCVYGYWRERPVQKPSTSKAMTWSSFQIAVFKHACESLRSLFVEAVAGSGKTTTLVETCR
jgi:hypothetical protein